MMKSKVSIILFALSVAIVGAIIMLPLFSHYDEASEGELVWDRTTEIEIVCVGDIMSHMSYVDAQRQEDGTYDFNYSFKHIKNYIEDADMAICNLETTFSGEPFTGYPAFSAPDEMADSILNTGFDVVVTSNNHMADRGKKGIIRTLEVLREKGFHITGSRENIEKPRYTIYENKDGVKIATIAYTYQTPREDGEVALNGILLAKETAELVNSFSYEKLDEGLSKIKSDMDAARKDGADIIVIYYHWGEEYQTKANQWQRIMAQKTAEMGADIIFASHPHNLQEAETISLEDGREVPVFYSMGNFISNQRRESMGSDKTRTEIGCIARAFITYNITEGKIASIKSDAIPTWVERYSQGGKMIYTIIPLDENLEDNEDLKKSGHMLRAQKAWEEGNGLLGINGEI